ncbi:hypothetical protein ACHQM5_026238 [Ranunculus cassubicifolius]
MSVTSESMDGAINTDRTSEHDLARKEIQSSNSMDGAANTVTVDEDLTKKEIKSSENEKNEALDLSEAYSKFGSIADSFSSAGRDDDNAANIKLDVDSCICVLQPSIFKFNEDLTCDVLCVLDDLKQLPLVTQNESDEGLDSYVGRVKEVFQKLREIRPRLQPCLDTIFMQKDGKAADQNLQTIVAPVAESNSNKTNEKNKGKGKSKSKKNKKKSKGKK